MTERQLQEFTVLLFVLVFCITLAVLVPAITTACLFIGGFAFGGIIARIFKGAQ
jgi:hypothetical protein